MKIIINVSSYYDWVLLPEDEQHQLNLFLTERGEWEKVREANNKLPLEEQTELPPEPVNPIQGVLKPEATGKWMRRTLVENPTYTEIGMPPLQVDNAMSAMAAQGLPGDSRELAIAWLLRMKVMPHHAPPEAWTKVTVETGEETDQATSELLTKMLNIGAQK